MLLNQFGSRFPSEESCIEYFKDIRQQYGVACPDCGEVTRKWLKGRKAFQCPKCGCSIPLTKGTVMEHSKLSIYTWFYTMHLMTSIKQVLSAKEVQYQLGIDQYPPVWLMMMKLRSIMGKRESRGVLLIIFRSPTSLCFVTCLIGISFKGNHVT